MIQLRRVLPHDETDHLASRSLPRPSTARTTRRRAGREAAPGRFPEVTTPKTACGGRTSERRLFWPIVLAEVISLASGRRAGTDHPRFRDRAAKRETREMKSFFQSKCLIRRAIRAGNGAARDAAPPDSAESLQNHDEGLGTTRGGAVYKKDEAAECVKPGDLSLNSGLLNRERAARMQASGLGNPNGVEPPHGYQQAT